MTNYPELSAENNSARQDASAAQAVPDALPKHVEDECDSGYVTEWKDGYVVGWNACRDAMISANPSEQAQQPASTPDDGISLMRAIVAAGQRAGIIRADLETVSGIECLHILECLVPADAPKGEPVGWVDDGGIVFWKDVAPVDGTDLYTAPVDAAAIRNAALDEVAGIAEQAVMDASLSYDAEKDPYFEGKMDAAEAILVAVCALKTDQQEKGNG